MNMSANNIKLTTNQPFGGGVRIRPLTHSDALTSYIWRNDKEVFRYTGNTYTNVITQQMEVEWIDRVIAKEDDYRCAILVNNVYVGNIYLTDIDGEKATYHIFVGDKNYWGKGVAKEASIQILTYAFDVLKLQYVELKVNELNVRAIQLYRCLGFEETGKANGWIHMVKNNIKRDI